MAIEKYVIDKSDLTALLRGETLAIQPKGNIRGFCVEIAGNLTNGEVIQALFPEVKIEIDGFFVYCEFIEHEFTTTEGWWNAPYKAESEVSDANSD